MQQRAGLLFLLLEIFFQHSMIVWLLHLFENVLEMFPSVIRRTFELNSFELVMFLPFSLNLLSFILNCRAIIRDGR